MSKAGMTISRISCRCTLKETPPIGNHRRSLYRVRKEFIVFLNFASFLTFELLPLWIVDLHGRHFRRGGWKLSAQRKDQSNACNCHQPYQAFHRERIDF